MSPWLSGKRAWLSIQRSGFDFRTNQVRISSQILHSKIVRSPPRHQRMPPQLKKKLYFENCSPRFRAQKEKYLPLNFMLAPWSESKITGNLVRKLKMTIFENILVSENTDFKSLNLFVKSISKNWIKWKRTELICASIWPWNCKANLATSGFSLRP